VVGSQLNVEVRRGDTERDACPLVKVEGEKENGFIHWSTSSDVLPTNYSVPNVFFGVTQH
ncbi:unnamed protein product, partial [Boreogadus saida]